VGSEGESGRIEVVWLSLGEGTIAGGLCLGLARAERGVGRGVSGTPDVGGGVGAGTSFERDMGERRTRTAGEIGESEGPAAGAGVRREGLGSGLVTRLARKLNSGSGFVFGFSTSNSSRRKRKSSPYSWRSCRPKVKSERGKYGLWPGIEPFYSEYK
jgi:hypothetical protein